MKIPVYTLAAAAVALLLSGNSCHVNAITTQEAIDLRTNLEAELSLFKKKDAYRLRDHKARGANNGDEDAEPQKSKRYPKGDSKSRKTGSVKGSSSSVTAVANRTKRKMLTLKLHILKLAETASEEDLTAMLSVYEELAELQIAVAEKRTEKGLHRGSIKEKRQELDNIASKYGGLKKDSARPKKKGTSKKEQQFSEEEAKKVKDLRKQLNSVTDEAEAEAIRAKLQEIYETLKFAEHDKAMAKEKEYRAKKQASIADHQAARKAKKERMPKTKADKGLRKPTRK